MENVETEDVIFIEVKIQNNDNINKRRNGGRKLDRKPVRHENFDTIESDELLNK